MVPALLLIQWQKGHLSSDDLAGSRAITGQFILEAQLAWLGLSRRTDTRAEIHKAITVEDLLSRLGMHA